VHTAQELEQFFVLHAREARPDCHVRRDILVVGERPLCHRAGIMALVAIHRKHLAAGEGIFKALALLTGPWYAQGGGALR
jgi:hypothetical protein